MSALTGQQILHYRVGRRLGAGGMGEVYLAEDTRLGRQVAMKFLPASYQYDKERRERFHREARAASALRSPHIAAIYDINEFDGSIFIVMEFVEGEVLAKRIERGVVPAGEAIETASQVADALDEAHGLGIIHRDIKSANLMLTPRGLVKVLDFGLAKINIAGRYGQPGDDRTVPLGNETVAGVVLGTVSFMSPEQALGREVDGRSDLFSLGVVLYHMLTGRLPFQGGSPTEIIDQIVHQEPAAVARFNYNVPSELERIIRKAMEKNPDYRYQTARELFIDLRNLRRDMESPRTTVSVPAPPSSDHLPTTMLSNPTGAAIARAAQANSVAVLAFTNITREAADSWIGSGIAETVTSDLKNIRGISVIGRERVSEVMESMSSGELPASDDQQAISVGRRLGAAYIINGGYQRLGDMLRITARLVEVASGAVLRTVKIDGKVSDIFELQDRIVYGLMQGLNLQLGTSEINAIEREETTSVEAYEYFSRGMINIRAVSRDSLDRATVLFEKAVELDPNYATAWATLAAVYDLKGTVLSMPELSFKAIECARKALAIDPNLSDAHEALGSSLLSIGHHDEAIQSLKEAVRLDPTNDEAHSSLARAYWVGKGLIEEAIHEFEHAIAINPHQGYSFLQLAMLLTIRGDYARAEKAAQRAADLQQRYISGKEGLQIVGGFLRLGYVYYRQGRYEEALEQFNKEAAFLNTTDHILRERTGIELDQKIGATYFRMGNEEEAEKHFKRALKHYQKRLEKGADDPHTKYYIASVHAMRGEADEAIRLLGETFERLRAINRLRAATDPDFENLRDDPRFRNLIGQS